MLSYVDRVQLAVPDRAEAVRRWQALFDAEVVGEDGSRILNAHRTTVRAGASEFEFLEPAGDGPVAAFVGRWRQGLYGVGFSTPDVPAMARHLDVQHAAYTEERGRLHLHSDATPGMPVMICPDRPRAAGGGLVSFVYEVTHPVADWTAAAERYARLFGLDASRFCPIRSREFGYEGTLTLFDPPARLDRIEITQTSGGGAMDRFFQRRGPSLYMCYIEVPDVLALAARLEANQARYASSNPAHPEVGLFVHPSALFGMLMGVSRTNFAWAWSGRPDLAGPGAATMHREE